MFFALFFIPLVLSNGLDQYEKPRGMYKLGAKFWSSIRTHRPYNYRTHAIQNTNIGDILEPMFHEHPNHLYNTTYFDHIGRTYAPLVMSVLVLTMVLMFWSCVWCCVQCCKCCCFPTRKYVDPVCCWSKTGPSKWAVYLTKCLFLVMTLVMIIPTIFSLSGMTALSRSSNAHFDAFLQGTNASVDLLDTLLTFTNITAPFKPIVTSIANGTYPPAIVAAATEIADSIESADNFILTLSKEPLRKVTDFRDRMESDGKLQLRNMRLGFTLVIVFAALYATARVIISLVTCCCCGSTLIGCQICCEFTRAVFLGFTGVVIMAMAVPLSETSMFIYGGAGEEFMGRKAVVDYFSKEVTNFLGDDVNNTFSPAHYISFNKTIFLDSIHEFVTGTPNTTVTPFLTSINSSLSSFGAFFDLLTAEDDTNPLLRDDPSWTIPAEVLADLQQSATDSTAARVAWFDAVAEQLNPAVLSDNLFPVVNVLAVDYARIFSVWWLCVVIALPFSIVYLCLLMCGRCLWDQYAFTIDSAGRRVFFPMNSVSGKRIRMLNTNGDPDEEQGGASGNGGSGQPLPMGRHTVTPQPVLYYQRGASVPMTLKDEEHEPQPTYYSAYQPSVTPPFSCSYATGHDSASASPSAPVSTTHMAFQPYPQVNALHPAPNQVSTTECNLPAPIRFSTDNPPPPPPFPAPLPAI